MRIAQIAPLYERVLPKLYGGTERIVSYLTDELVRQGHDVTLFASGDSKTSAKLVPCCDTAIRLDAWVRDPLPYHIIMLEKVRQRIDQFDVLHFHIDFLHAPLIRSLVHRTVSTHHGRLDSPDLAAFYRIFLELPLISVSQDQRKYLPQANWIGTVYHGLPRDLLPFQPKAKGGYLAFLSRISPEKGPNRAIEIAARAAMPLKIAAKVLVDAAALLFPVDWPEPFGLVLIEAMACGTPVIAFRRGSVAEVLEDGTSGFIVDTIEDAVTAVRRIGSLDRAKIRADFEQHFKVERMARDYLDIYQRRTATKPNRFPAFKGRDRVQSLAADLTPAIVPPANG